MKYSSVNRHFPAGNPIANVFVIIAGVLIIGISVVVGFFAFVVLAAIIGVLATIVSIRGWWFARKLGAANAGGGARPGAQGRPESGRVIEGEFHEVGVRRDKDD